MPGQIFSVNDLLAHTSATANRILDDRLPKVHEGLVMDGSYDGSEHTFAMKLGDTDAAALLDGNQVGMEGGIVLMSTYGEFYCPRGGERAVIMESQGGGFNGWLHSMNGDGVARTDTPATLGYTMQPGEKLSAHLTGDPVNPKADAHHYFKNDGGTSGDKKGGLDTLAGGKSVHRTTLGHQMSMDDVLKQIKTQTVSGHVVSLDDTLRQIKVATAAGFHTLYDDAGRAISHVTPAGLKSISSDVTAEISHIAPHIGLGDVVANLDATQAAVNKGHLTTLSTNINSLRQDDLVKFAAAMVSAGVPNAGAVIGLLASLTGITVPAGSAITKIKG